MVDNIFFFHDQHRNLFHRDRNIFIIVKLFLLTEFFLSPSCRVSFRGSVCVAVSWFCGSPIFRHFRVVLFFLGSPWVSWLSLFAVWPAWLQFLFVTYSCMEIVLIPMLFFFTNVVNIKPKKHFLTLHGSRFFLWFILVYSSLWTYSLSTLTPQALNAPPHLRDRLIENGSCLNNNDWHDSAVNKNSQQLT